MRWVLRNANTDAGVEGLVINIYGCLKALDDAPGNKLRVFITGQNNGELIASQPDHRVLPGIKLVQTQIVNRLAADQLAQALADGNQD